MVITIKYLFFTILFFTSVFSNNFENDPEIGDYKLFKLKSAFQNKSVIIITKFGFDYINPYYYFDEWFDLTQENLEFFQKKGNINFVNYNDRMDEEIFLIDLEEFTLH